MIYGLNFNGTQIPAEVAKRFHKEHGSRREGTWVRLQGVCNTKEEHDMMLIQADNGHRTLDSVGPRKIGEETWYAIYCG